MPCDQRITVVSRLEKADQATLVKALAALRLDPYVIGTAIQFQGGRFQPVPRLDKDGKPVLDEKGEPVLDGQLVLAGYGYGAGLDEKINAIKQAYSVQVVKTAAAQWGWDVQATQSDIEGGQAFEVRQEG